MLKIALEPEAASIYCQTFPSPGSKDITKIGAKYMVVDLGGRYGNDMDILLLLH